MANRTDPLAATVHGTNPQVPSPTANRLLVDRPPPLHPRPFPPTSITTIFLDRPCASSAALQNLVEQIVRSRIYDCQYWKEHCFGLTAESLLDKAVDLRAIGGTFGADTAVLLSRRSVEKITPARKADDRRLCPCLLLDAARAGVCLVHGVTTHL